MRKPTIFISSSVEGLPIAQEFALQLEPSTTPILWSEGILRPGKTEFLIEAADRADFAIFVLTSDDNVAFRKARSRVPRLNLIFEIGYLAGLIGPSRTFLVAEPEQKELPSDLRWVTNVLLPKREPSDLPPTVAPAASAIAKAIARLGLRSERRSELSSCFISYSRTDKDFAAHLHDDLQKVGIGCWLDAKEIRAADSISDQINRAIQAHDKVLIVLSRSSIRSSWVNEEIRKASDLERARDSTVLFLIRLDDAVFTTERTADLARLKNRTIIDFRGWHDKSQYQRAFSQLVRDLAISASVESEGRE